MGGCQAAVAVGWSALCGVVQFAGQAQSVADRVTGAASAATAAGPLSLALLLVLGVVGMAVAWYVFRAIAEVVFRYFPLVLVAGLVVLYITH